MTEAQPIVFTSFAPEDFVQGGLIDDVDISIKDAVWTLETPPDYHSRDPVFGVKMWLSMVEDPDQVVDQWWSCGTLKAQRPCTPEGEEAAEGPLLTGGSLMRNSNFHELMKSMIEAGVPVALAKSGDLRKLIGIEVHVQRKTIKREGLEGAPREGGRTPQVLLVTKLLRMPGEKRAPKAKPAAAAGAAASRPAAAAATRARTAAPAAVATSAPISTEAAIASAAGSPAAQFDAATVAVEILSNMLESNPGGISLAAAKLAVNTELVHTYKTSLLQRNKVVALLFSPGWLAGQGVKIEEETLVLAD